MYVAYTFKLSI